MPGTTRLILSFLSIAMIAYSAGESADSARFIGSWNLISYELRLASGSVLKPFGDHPVGRILYQQNGQMSAQLMGPVRQFANSDPREAKTEEAAAAWRNYIGYWGTFTVDAKRRVMTHRIEGGWFPNWIGQNQARSYRFSGEDLTLEADTTAWHATLTWRKIH